MIYDFLDSQGIQYQRVDHPPVNTCEEAKALVPHLAGAETKNLFLRDGKGRRHFLLSVPPYKNVSLKTLAALLEINGLSFASPERLLKHLGLTPGAVTLLGVVNDRDQAVELLIDNELWQKGALLCHPLVNTSTLRIDTADLLRVFAITGHSPRFLDVPTS